MTVARSTAITTDAGVSSALGRTAGNRQSGGRAPHDPLFIERWASATPSRPGAGPPAAGLRTSAGRIGLRTRFGFHDQLGSRVWSRGSATAEDLGADDRHDDRDHADDNEIRNPSGHAENRSDDSHNTDRGWSVPRRRALRASPGGSCRGSMSARCKLASGSRLEAERRRRPPSVRCPFPLCDAATPSRNGLRGRSRPSARRSTNETPAASQPKGLGDAAGPMAAASGSSASGGCFRS